MDALLLQGDLLSWEIVSVIGIELELELLEVVIDLVGYVSQEVARDLLLIAILVKALGA